MSLKKLLIIVFFLFFTRIGSVFSQCIDARPLVELIESHHYHPAKKDSALSTQIFNQFLKSIDPNRRILTKEDISSLETYRTTLFSHLKSPCEFLKPVHKLFLKRHQTIVDYLSDEKIDVDFNNSNLLLNTATFNKEYPKDEAELINKWRKIIAYRTLHQLASTNDTIYSQATTDSLFLIEKRKTLCSLEESFSQEKETLKQIEDLFFDAIANAYDPHTSYFTINKKEQFTEQLSKEATGFGIAIGKNQDNEFRIVAIQPGSPAWNTQQLNVDDKIIALKHAQKEFDLNCTSQQAIRNELNDKAINQITITIQKKDGKIEDVKIIRGKIDVEKNAIQGLILNDNAKKIGYIAIPSFYTSWDNNVANGCANDVAKEILKLKMSNIEGLIIDLRYNAGGSFIEAINLAGIFIDFGPISMTNTNENQPDVHKDLNRGMAYSGPLTVLVNGGSASASELFAATMQDYNRALIVGTTTYGKASGQSFYPLFINQNYKTPYASVKITGSVLYRLDGSSHQAEGVTPDIIIADGWENLIRKESDYKHVLPNSTIDKKAKYTPFEEQPVSQLSEMSKLRLANDSTHNERIRHIQSITDFELDSIIPLSIADFSEYFQQQNYLNALYTKEIPVLKPINVTNHSYDNRLFSFSEEENNANLTTLEHIKNDWQINEAYSITNDFINLINSSK